MSFPEVVNMYNRDWERIQNPPREPEFLEPAEYGGGTACEGAATPDPDLHAPRGGDSLIENQLQSRSLPIGLCVTVDHPGGRPRRPPRQMWDEVNRLMSDFFYGKKFCGGKFCGGKFHPKKSGGEKEL